MVDGIHGNVTAICEIFRISCLMGKSPYERRFGVPFNGPVIPFGAMVEYHPVSAAKSLARYFPRLSITRGENLERRPHVHRHWRIGGDGRIRTPRQKAQCKGSVNADERWQFYIPSRRWNSQNPWRRSTSESIHLNQGSSWTRRGTRSFSRIQTNSLLQHHFKTTQHGMMRLQETSFIAITWNPESNCTCREKHHFLFLWSASTLPEQHKRHRMYCWRKYWWWLGRGWRKRIIRCMDRLHKIHFVERKAT